LVKYKLHRNQIYTWKNQLPDGGAMVFAGGTVKEASREAEVRELRKDLSAEGGTGFSITGGRPVNRAELMAIME
jgi:transposase-like protein